jgi:hypothetical protein
VYGSINPVLGSFCLFVCVLLDGGLVRVICTPISVITGMITFGEGIWSMCGLLLLADIICQLLLYVYDMSFYYEYIP